MSDIIKRLHYFNQQFLTEKDFTDEQDYHLQRRRQHNQFLHTPGIAAGLTVEKTTVKGVKEVTVRPGTAIDISGQEIVQDKDFPIDLSNATDFPKKSTVYVTIQYTEVLSEEDRQIPDKPGTETRFLEKPLIKASINSPATDGTIIQLAKFQLDDNGNVPGQIGDKLDGGVRKSVGSVLSASYVSTKQLKTEVIADIFDQAQGLRIPKQTSSEVVAFESQLEKLIASNNSRFLLVYAYSVTEGAIFVWEQQYTTEKRKDNTTWVKQSVVFKNISDIDIEIKYRIYAVLES